jgi:hypothetical protein
MHAQRRYVQQASDQHRMKASNRHSAFALAENGIFFADRHKLLVSLCEIKGFIVGA